jgi:hypothetical protein
MIKAEGDAVSSSDIHHSWADTNRPGGPGRNCNQKIGRNFARLIGKNKKSPYSGAIL